jgi:hypothetical protein
MVGGTIQKNHVSLDFSSSTRVPSTITSSNLQLFLLPTLPTFNNSQLRCTSTYDDTVLNRDTTAQSVFLNPTAGQLVSYNFLTTSLLLNNSPQHLLQIFKSTSNLLFKPLLGE